MLIYNNVYRLSIVSGLEYNNFPLIEIKETTTYCCDYFMVVSMEFYFQMKAKRRKQDHHLISLDSPLSQKDRLRTNLGLA